MKTHAKAMPSLRSAAAAEACVATADRSADDLSGFKPMRFDRQAQSAAVHLRLPAPLLEALQIKATSKGVPYTRSVRMWLEADLTP
jgi:predicted DNA binding CopG/RHH family protein